MIGRIAAIGLAMLWAGALAGPAAAQSAGSPWGARAPLACPTVKGPAPSAAQAAALVRCAKEYASASSGESWLVEDLKVEIGGRSTFAALYPLITMQGADPRKPTYPIRGGWTWSICILRADAGLRGDPNLNCRETAVTAATGGCWQTTFGDWKCTMNGQSGETRRGLRPRGK